MDGTIDARAATILHGWITGRRASGRVLFAESALGVDELAARAGANDAVIVPDGAAPTHCQGTVLRYRGELCEAGDEMRLGGVAIELQDYIGASFIEILGPTAVRFPDERGWRAFVEDADLARATGVFPAVIVDPRLQLADREVLTSPLEHAAPTSLCVTADGRVRLGPQGADVGGLDALDKALTTPRPGIDALSGAVPSEVLRADVVARPWLGRYLRAGDLIRAVGLDRGRQRIGGFGGALVDDGGADADPHLDDPLMVLADDEVLLVDLRTRRRQRLDRTTARIVEVVQTSGTADRAARRIAAATGTTAGAAAELCARAIRELGVHLGRTDGITG